MAPTIKEQLSVIARRVRRWAEITKPKGWADDLEMMCARASGELFKQFRRAGFRPVIVFQTYHAYVRCNGFTIDVTATQFNRSTGPQYNPVEVLTTFEAAQTKLWKPSCDDVVLDSLKKARTHQQRQWPRDQWVDAKPATTC